MCTSKTWSEKLFENWCRENGVNFRCIPREEGRRTPDYELVVNGTTIIAEVKHIDDNSEEKINRQRIRKKIKKCQLSTWIKAKKYSGPAILVLYESQPYKHLTPNDLLDGMYGKLQIPWVIERVQGRSEFRFGLINSGRDRMMTPNDNTSISAIVVFPYLEPKRAIVDVYHNRYATRPLDQETFTFPNLDVKHYFKHPHLAHWVDSPHLEDQKVDLKSQLEALSGQTRPLEERNTNFR